MSLVTPISRWVYQYRLWEESDFDEVTRRKNRAAAELRAIAEVKAALCTPLTAAHHTFREWEALQWQQTVEEYYAGLEDLARDPEASERRRLAARITLAGRNYKRKEFDS